MVLGLLAVTGIPTTIGVWQGVSQSRRQPDPEEEARRSKECHLKIHCDSDRAEQAEVHDKYVVLRDNKAYISTLTDADSFPFTGFYIDYPSEERHRGLVTLTSLTPPAMGWLFVDKNTLEARYGNKSASIEHIKGPWDWTEGESGLVLEGKEAFVAVKEEDGKWRLYFDPNEDSCGLPKGRVALPISLDRIPKEEVDQQVD